MAVRTTLPVSRVVLQIAFALLGFAIAWYLADRVQNKAAEPAPHPHAAEREWPGLAAGATVTFENLSTLSGHPADLDRTGREYVLCAFFSTACPGCAEDVHLWKALDREAASHGLAFRPISIDPDTERIGRFARAYDFESLPILFDHVHDRFQIEHVPQYILLTAEGRVVRRWNGVQHRSAGTDATGAPDPGIFFRDLKR